MKIKYYPDADALDIKISDEKPDFTNCMANDLTYFHHIW